MSLIKKICILAVVVAAFAKFSFCADTTIVIMWGDVKDLSGNAIANATVTLKNANLSETTNDAGYYKFYTFFISAVLPQAGKASFYQRPFLRQGRLVFGVSGTVPQKVSIDLFSLSGKKIASLANTSLGSGNYQLDVTHGNKTSQVYLLRARIGDRISFFRVPFVGRRYSDCSAVRRIEKDAGAGVLAKKAALLDSLVVSAPGFTSESRPIESYEGTHYFALRTAAQAGMKKVNIAFALEQGTDPLYDPQPPTLCTTIWVADLNNNYVTTQYVNEWLSSNGYRNPLIVCPDWLGPDSMRWSKIKDSIPAFVDAVTRATPNIGMHTFDYCPLFLNLPQATYRFCIEVNSSDQYHVFYTADIGINGSDLTLTPSPVYRPERPANSTVDVIDHVTFSYK